MDKIDYIIKRNSSKVPYQKKKIEEAIYKAMKAVKVGTIAQAKEVTEEVHKKLLTFKKKDHEYIPTVEGVQDIVEETLMKKDLYQVAKAYILYREERNRKRQRNIFEKRLNLKPYEYPELVEYVNSIRFSYWIHTEFNFTGDVQDYKTKVTKSEKNALKNAMLAISQIEVSVKTFWAYLYRHLPKPEIGSVGATFAESEVRHHDAYSHLIEILGLNEEFENLKKIPVIMKRVDYLETAIAHSNSDENQKFSESLLLFSLFIEHVSLFSQFLIIMSFNKYKNIFKGISNAVEATSKEEQIHGNFGIEVINIIKDENPDWFTPEHAAMVQEMCRKAYESEAEVIDWIYEEGELDFLPSKVVKEFIKNRLNNSLKSIGIDPVFEVDPKLVEQSDWFDDEVIGTKHGDFFVKRSINYSKRVQSITSEDLF
ncbi:MAG TPA: ribonucleotide-diphosphate reductase subunit beta [Candidatus Dojkabacteria bacterium]|nr:ribonucleotide-diphosphate reductase subunit beta [Candidatus Dojkabacteria bacterium]